MALNFPSSTTQSGSYSHVYRRGYLLPTVNFDPVEHSGYMITRTDYHTAVGRETPNYWEKRKNGDPLPFNPYKRVDEVTLTPPISFSRAYSSFDSKNTRKAWMSDAGTVHAIFTYGEVKHGIDVYYKSGGHYISTSSILTRMIDAEMQNPSLVPNWHDMLNSALAALNTGTDVGPFLAGLNQTRKMILQLVGKLKAFVLKLVEMIRSGRASERTPLALLAAAQRELRLRNSKDIANVYLEVIYGWRPLVGDIMAIIARLRSLTESQSRRSKYIRRKRDLATAVDVDSTIEYITSPSGFYRGNVSTIVVARLTGRISVGFLARAMGTPHFGGPGFVLNPLSTLWDVVPWSFMIDTIVDIGSFLEAAQVGLTVRVLGLCKGSYTQVVASLDLSAKTVGSDTPGPGDRLDTWSVSATASLTSESYLREPVKSIPRLPGIRSSDSPFNHLWEILALIVQKVGKPVWFTPRTRR